jgi:hypothetical protein
VHTAILGDLLSATAPAVDDGFISDQNAAFNGGTGATTTNFWFVEVAEQNIIDGIRLPGKQIVRIALAEWTAPVLDNTP